MTAESTATAQVTSSCLHLQSAATLNTDSVTVTPASVHVTASRRLGRGSVCMRGFALALLEEKRHPDFPAPLL